MAANTKLQLTSVDFDSLKRNLITHLQSQDTFKDYNFEGSALNNLIDLLVYNTQYNAYYLNMVANEMFLDSATQRSSVISHAKLLNYTPKSAICPTATVNVTFNGVTGSSLVLPAYSIFSSSSINGVNYTFINPNSYVSDVVNGTVNFENVEIKQGVLSGYNYTVDSSSNPNYSFEIPDESIDTTTLRVIVQESSSNNNYVVYNRATDYLTLDSESEVYFIEESLSGNYQLIFGNGILGKKLTDGNIISISYISTEGTSASGANSFVLMETIDGYAPSSVTSVISATQGGDKEDIDSIKYQAPKNYSAQNRAVTKEDYITLIQQNNLGYAFDAVNVWGGEENDPPAYGQIFISLKPNGGLTLSTLQKQQIANKVIKPISMMTVTPQIVDPDYTFLKITANVYVNTKKTVLTTNQIQTKIVDAIRNFGDNTLNTFNSVYSISDLMSTIQKSDQSIVSCEVDTQLQKKVYPNLLQSETYKLYYGTSLNKGVFLSGVSSLPSMTFLNPKDNNSTIDGVYIQELPTNVGGIESISIINPGLSYQSAPNITINGDGVGATAEAIINSMGQITAINVLTQGSNYSTANIVITPQLNDTTGKMAYAVPKLTGTIGTLQTYYYDNNNVKTILDPDIGTIDYNNGLIILTNFQPLQISNPFGQLTITTNPVSSIISSTLNRIITIDSLDPSAVTVNVIVQ